MAQDLRLGYVDSIKFIASIAAGRWPNHQSVLSINGGYMPVRWNRTDAFIVREVMCSAYRAKATPDRILDLGAHIGTAALYFSRLWPQASIACVEPHTENLSVLKRTVALNNLRVRIFPVAAAVADGTVEFFVSRDASSNSLVGRPAWEKRDVPALSVNTLMKELGWDHIHLLKIDIEGYESQLLSRNVDWLACTHEIVGEAHDGYSTHAMAGDLGRYGFSVEILSSNEKFGMRIFHAFKKN